MVKKTDDILHTKPKKYLSESFNDDATYNKMLETLSMAEKKFFSDATNGSSHSVLWEQSSKSFGGISGENNYSVNRL